MHQVKIFLIVAGKISSSISDISLYLVPGEHVASWPAHDCSHYELALGLSTAKPSSASHFTGTLMVITVYQLFSMFIAVLLSICNCIPCWSRSWHRRRIEQVV